MTFFKNIIEEEDRQRKLAEELQQVNSNADMSAFNEEDGDHYRTSQVQDETNPRKNENTFSELIPSGNRSAKREDINFNEIVHAKT
jgi:ribonuclease D